MEMHRRNQDPFEGGLPSSGNSIYSPDQTPQQTPYRRRSLETASNTGSDNINAAPRNPFNATPLGTSKNSSAIHIHHQKQNQKYFRSRRVKKGEVDHPWKTTNDPRKKWVTIIPLIGLALGFAVAGYLVYNGLTTIVSHTYTLVLNEDWSNGFNTNVWTKEVNLGGFGNGEFEQTTGTEENVMIENGKLIIKPTLQDETLLTTNNNLTLPDCTSTLYYDCNAATNVTNGTIVPPVKSGRINTLKGATIKYGRVEVVATMPEGDWLWPAIWMLPVNNTFGPWPASGEIDIVESRGNNYSYPTGGNNIVTSTLHWGPDKTDDGYWRTSKKQEALHTTYAAGEHTYGLEWSEKYLFTYIDTRLLQILYNPFNEYLWTRGQFPLSNSNGTTLTNPWVNDPNLNSPFDQEFYLIINLAVGGTNGWFKDGAAGKPWVDKSKTAPSDFLAGKDQWYPTWKPETAQLSISSVKMWQQVDNKPNTPK
ncbi:MAG: hypothetical protein ALECFALPRED_009087 [Alectoria fallacina]|uniref:GH16 domain-containing protein n=1 Tax=Alectoria fallacina TaxID=1903189 RepID=A0A8H3PIA1_9LECA|nr:MAG: hypothetical protein ALECFALPRED_009087 [Alectoria fallacina]